MRESVTYIRRPMPTLTLEAIRRELDKLTDEQMDDIQYDHPEQYFSSRSNAAMYYQDAIRRGWLLGPA